MLANTAALLPDVISDHPDERIGVLLRPCEMRALIEMSKHASFPLKGVLTIAVDCLGTMPPEDYMWRAERRGSSGSLDKTTLKFARQGGIQAYRYRAACQFCSAPNARGADINFGVIGLPVRQTIAFSVPDPVLQDRLKIDEWGDGQLPRDLLEQRARTLAKMLQRHLRTYERVIHSLGDLLPDDVDDLVRQIEACGDCQACMQACPICSVDFPRPGEEQRYLRQDVMRWLVSCDGCGMCEQACPRAKPLTAIFTDIRDELAEALGYSPGMYWDQVLPVA
jgi:formate dehydrogenase subunit beta